MSDEDLVSGDAAVLDNPAARLQFWLEIGQERAVVAAKEGQAVQRNGNRSQRTQPHQMLGVWCAIWELEPNDRADRVEYTRRAMGMIDAGVEVRRLAEASTNFMAPTALEHFHEVEQALNMFMEAPSLDISKMMDKIAPTGWHSLKMLDNLLSNEAPQPIMSDKQVGDLLRQTQDLIASVAEATDLSEEDRLLLAEKLHDVEVALTRARVTGTTDVLRATDGLMGGLMRLYLRGVDVMTHPLAKSVWALVAALVAIVGVGAGASEIASGPFAEMLGLPTATSDDPGAP